MTVREATTATTPQTNHRPPSIVFITTDTQGREALSCYVSRPGVVTPHLDRLAAEGVLFQNAYTASPVCTPARSAWFTGLHPSRNGAWGNEMSPARHVPMLAETLVARGYRACHLGKWHLDGAGYNGAGRASGGFAPEPWYDLSNFYDEVGRDGPNRFGGWNKGLEDERFCFGHRVADRAIDVLRTHDYTRPLFLTVSLDEPHGPYICPPPFRGRFRHEDIYRPPTFPAAAAGLADKPVLQRDYAAWLEATRPAPEAYPDYYHRYWDCNTYADYEIGRVLDGIDRHCPDDTVVIFTSDHGDHLGAFGLGAKGPTMYDHTTAVPLIVRGRGFGQPGRREEPLASGVDVWATILDLAGGAWDEPPFTGRAGYSARSLVPVLRGTADAARDHVIVEYNRFGVYQRQVNGFAPIRCVRTRRWKLVVNLFDLDELYDLETDPEERHNLIGESGLDEVRCELHQRLLVWQESTSDPFRGPGWEARPWRPDARPVFEGLRTTGFDVTWPVEVR